MLGLIGVTVAWRIAKKKEREFAEQNTDALRSGAAVELQTEPCKIGRLLFGLVMIAGAIALSGVTVVCWCLTANALLDQSASIRQPVQITEMVQVTHAFLFREYKVEYCFLQDQDKRSILTTPQHLSQFGAPVGMAVIREGWLGWPWVETIEPVLVINDAAPADLLKMSDSDVPNAEACPDCTRSGSLSGLVNVLKDFALTDIL